MKLKPLPVVLCAISLIAFLCVFGLYRHYSAPGYSPGPAVFSTTSEWHYDEHKPYFAPAERREQIRTNISLLKAGASKSQVYGMLGTADFDLPSYKNSMFGQRLNGSCLIYLLKSPERRSVGTYGLSSREEGLVLEFSTEGTLVEWYQQGLK